MRRRVNAFPSDQISWPKMSCLPKLKKPVNSPLSMFSPLTKNWLKTTEAVLGEDKETFSMVLFLVKKYSKQKMNYESLLVAIEELLPTDHVGTLLETLYEICENNLEQDFEEDNVNYTISSNENQDVQNQKKHSINALNPSPKKPKLADLICNAIREDTPPHEEDPKVTFVHLPLYIHTPDLLTPNLSDIESPVSHAESPNAKARRKSAFNVGNSNDLLAHLQYIVTSLDRHSESYILKNKENDPISPFKKILQKSEANEYRDLVSLEKDVERMLNSLKRQDIAVDRVKKHFEYLSSYFFPSRTVGKLRSRRF